MNPTNFMALREQVKTDEGLRLKPYVDTVGKITIGYGRNLSDVGISDAEAAALLDHDLETTVARLTLVHPDVLNLDPVRQIVLANMAFNMGVSALGTFHRMWDAIDRGNWTEASAAMLDSTWARQVGARATRLAAAMKSGTL
jgi:lysozyme